MKLSSKIFAIIPARGGSKGLPRKNIKSLAGKPLIVYSIQAGLNCNKISRVIVSTEDSEIKKVSLDWGADVIDRPIELATDNALTRDVVLHVLDNLSNESDLPDFFVFLQPTSPLRTTAHIESCLDSFFSSNAKCAISVTEVDHHPYKAFRLESGYLYPLFDIDYLDQSRQKLPKIFRQNGAIYVMQTKIFLKKKTFFVHPVMPFIMSRNVSIDIDTAFDHFICETILTNHELARANVRILNSSINLK